MVNWDNFNDPEYCNQHAGNTATHACSGGTPRGATAVLQGNAGKIEKPSKYQYNQPNQERNTFSVSLPRNCPGLPNRQIFASAKNCFTRNIFCAPVPAGYCLMKKCI
jgi:hypothetical protein